MKKIVSILFLSSFACNVFGQLTPLEIKLTEITQKNNVPAMGAMLIENGIIKNSGIVGVRKWGDPTLAKITDQFHLGSCTKAMTATLFATLVEEGKVDWTSTMKELFPEIINMDDANKNTTVEMLLAHRGGLTGDLFKFNNGSIQNKIRDPNLSASDGYQIVANDLLSSPPDVVPGSQKLYSNSGYIIVGRIIEKISGKTYVDLMNERIFKPLKMDSCGFGPVGDPNAVIPDQPWGHKQTANGPVAISPADKYADNPATHNPAGRVHCSMEDWGKFLDQHVKGFNHESTVILTSKSFDKLHTSYPGQAYTYGGWDRLSQSWGGGIQLAHEGSNTLNLASVWLAPLQKKIFMAVSNSDMNADDSTNYSAIMELVKEDEK